jgi:hypothetical protein
LVLLGCEDDSGNPGNTDPKKITINGIDDGVSENMKIQLFSYINVSDPSKSRKVA